MYFVWFALFLLSVSWWFLIDIFSPSRYEGYLFLFLSYVLLSIGLKQRIKIKLDKTSCLLLIPSFASCILLSYPFNIGFILLAIALLISFLSNNSRLRSMINVILVLSIILILQSVFFPLYYWLAPQNHNLQLFSPFLIALLKLSGFNAYWQLNSLFIETTNGIMNFTTTLEKSGFDFALIIVFGAIALMSLLRTISWNKTGIIFFITFIYSIIRFWLFVIIYLYTNQIDILWNRWFVVISFIPLILLYIKFIRMDNKVLMTLIIPFRKKQLWIGAWLFLSAFLLLSGISFQDPGEKKQGRILIDEKHSDWEWTTQKYDTSWYGEKSSYNYYCLYDFLSHYYKVERNFSTISPDILDKCDILIIKPPTSPFSTEEINVIVNFVKKGGSLFLLGDHTNVFGSSTFINPIAQQFNFKLNYDATYDLSTGKLSYYEPKKFLTHPVTQNLDFFLFGTSCSLETGLFAERIITGYGLKSIHLDYSEKNFFSALAESPGMSYGLFTQMAGVKRGKGRVLVFTDSTVFSNFWMFMSGKPELLLGSINWLNRQNKYLFLKYLLVISGLTFGILFFILQIKYRKSSFLFGILLFGNLGICSGIVASNFSNKICYKLSGPHSKLSTVSFDMTHSNIELPDKELNENPYKSYSTFYVWMQRINIVPLTNYIFDDAIKDTNIICIINPNKTFSPKQLNELYTYVSKGGDLLVLDDCLNNESTANQVLQIFSMNFEKQLLNQDFKYDTLSQSMSFTQPYMIVIGGNPIIFNERRQSVASINQIGKGKVIAFSNSNLFCDASMGTTNSFPNKNQNRIFQLEYRLLNQIAK